MRKDELVTVHDLENFKNEIINEIKKNASQNGEKPLNKWLKSAEVRKILDISPGKLLTMRHNGLLACTRIGGNIYYDQDDIKKMFENNKKVMTRK